MNLLFLCWANQILKLFVKHLALLVNSPSHLHLPLSPSLTPLANLYLSLLPQQLSPPLSLLLPCQPVTLSQMPPAVHLNLLLHGQVLNCLSFALKETVIGTSVTGDRSNGYNVLEDLFCDLRVHLHNNDELKTEKFFLCAFEKFAYRPQCC